MHRFAFCGTFVHSTAETSMLIVENACLGVVESKIVFFDQEDNLKNRLGEFNIPSENVTHLHRGQFVMPGMIDCHIHASQYPYAGTGLDKELFDWLKLYAFPTETKYSNNEYAQKAYTALVKRTLKNGTTTASYFGTIHTGASLILCDVMAKFGQRGYVGKVNMNTNAPDNYRESTKESVQETERFIQTLMSRQNPLVTPVITPRFSLSCDQELLKKLGDIAEKYSLPVQSHVGETRYDHKMILEQHPYCKHYTDSYLKNGLMTPKSYFAHAVHLTDEEVQIFKDRSCGIVHCPTSNLSCLLGHMDAKRYMKEGLKIGLGTDVAGGYSPSLLDAIRRSVHVSDVLALRDLDNYKPISHKEAFMFATLGGSKVLGLSDKIGNFEVGKEFDALIIDAGIEGGPIDIFDSDTTEDIVQKFLYVGDDRNITEVYVAGAKISS